MSDTADIRTRAHKRAGSALRNPPLPVRVVNLIAFVCFLHLQLSSTVRAGDILRGGSAATQARGNVAGNATAAAVQAGAPNASDTLSRTAQALTAVRAMQAAARTAAQNGANNLGADPNHPGLQLPNVPNGLTTNGLQVAPGVGHDPNLWQGANLATQTSRGSQTNVTIVQTAQQALLNWQTFNIGRDTHLLFDQTAGGANVRQWIAFNFINDPSGVPSQILGSIDALGQVYLMNANGIIFGGSSQINVHNLTASALPINTNLIARGLLNNPDNQFFFTALPLPAGANGGGTPAFTPPASNTPDGHYGDVTVQAGAQISSPTSADHVGGRVTLIGANVENAGTISTPDGQTILAAGLQVGFAAHRSADPSLRGLDTFVGAVVDPESDLPPYAGTATNGGLIDAPRANVTITGKNVNQLGFINSTTSVSLNGRIDLLADYNAVPFVNVDRQTLTNPPSFLFTSSGIATLGLNSVTQIVPEYTSTERIVGTELALASQVNIQGLAVHAVSDSILFAPSANASISAGNWVSYMSGGLPASQFIASGGQIYLDAYALIDLSGSPDVIGSVTENIVRAQLLGAELANSPVQRNGPLRGQTIYIDILNTGTYNGQNWIGTPLADVSGYANLVQRNVGELTINGGNLTMTAGDSVVLQPGATVNVSGGWIYFQGGNVRTTQLLSGGRVFDISQATPDRVYDGIAGTFNIAHSKWGILEQFANPFPAPMRFQAGFVQGGNGGNLTINAPSVALDGTFLGTTIAGGRQQTTPPIASAFNLNFQAQDPTPTEFLLISPFPPSISFGTGSLTPAAPFGLDEMGNPLPLSDERRAQVILSPDLVNVNGFGNLNIDNRDGDITVPEGVRLTTSAGGSVQFKAANLDVEGQIVSPGGTIALNVYDISRATLNALHGDPHPQTPPPDPTRGHFILGPNAVLNAAGMITDLRPTAVSPAGPTYTANGGSISVNSYDATFASGSVIDVSGGVTVSGTGQISYGNGGGISMSAGQDLSIASVIGGNLILNGTLSGFSGSRGGSLSLLAPSVQIGGTAPAFDALLLSPDFFIQGGFTSFTIAGLGAPTGQTDVFIPAVVISEGTMIQPFVQSLIAQLDPNGLGTLALTQTILPPSLRPPVSLSFRAPGVRDPFSPSEQQFVRGDFVMGRGALIETDALATVSISANTAAVLGTIIAPGGNISISGGGNTRALFSDQSHALPTVDLGPESFLSVAGTTVLTPNTLGLRTGSVLAGGNITVSGNIVAESGSVLDVSGATGMLDLAPGYSGGSPNGSFGGARFIPTRVDSNGGSITFSGGQELFLDATLLGVAGGPGAVGGTLSISSNRFLAPGVTSTPLDENIVVTQSGLTIPVPFYGPGENAIGHVVVDADGNPIFGEGHFVADTFNNSGLASLTLNGTVQFDGAVTLNAARSLVIARGGVIRADDAVSLNAPYVALGTAFRPPFATQEQTNAFNVGGQPFFFPSTSGTGSLSVSSSLIDIGNLSLQNISVLTLVAANGDLRGDGTLDVAGNISITAGQIYSPTATQFTITADTITLMSSGARPLPLSAGGQLNLYASIIDDSGVLRAPLGIINLGFDGTGTAPVNQISGQPFGVTQQVNLRSGSVTSVSAVDPLTGTGLTIPFGVNSTGTSWIDPAGNDVALVGIPEKSVNVAATHVSDQAGSIIDIRGGGDEFAWEFRSGTGGTIDVLNSPNSFAIIPGYQADYAPYAQFNSAAGTPGYVNTNLQVGDQIYLAASRGFPAGSYTLLPARYALLPGAFLVTPKSGTPGTNPVQPDGSTLISGYRFNAFDPPSSQPIYSSFEIASQYVVQQRAEYINFSANQFVRQIALDRGGAVQRLPIDSGHLLFDATETMSILGSLTSQPPTGGRGGLVDISSPVDILLAGPGVSGGPNELVLDSSAISAFGAESLLIGGIRHTTAGGTAVTVTTNNIVVDNAGAPLTGPDIILVANQNLTLDANSDIEQRGSLTSADSLLLGRSGVAGSGNGVLLRVSADPLAQIARIGVTSSNIPHQVIGANALISGASVTLDSTFATSLDPTAILSGSAVNLDSGQISIQLPNGSVPQGTSGLILAGVALQNLQSINALSLLSYSSIDIYGTGTITAANSLALHAGEIRGFNGGGTIAFSGNTILLDNSANATVPGPGPTQNGTLRFDAATIQFGENQLAIDQFANVIVNASRNVLLQDTGGTAVDGSLTISAPIIVADTRAAQTISASGVVNLQSVVGPMPMPSSGLGASLTISGASITDNIGILLPSGSVTLHARTGDVTVGNSSGATIDVGGTAQTFFDLVKYTSGGLVNLIADNGSVNVAARASINVGAQPGGGNAGTLAISAPDGSFFVDGTLNGAAGANGRNGSFVLDIGSLATLGGLSSVLNAASFTESRSIRVRTGDVIVDGLATSHNFSLSADQGSITVTGTIDGSGVTGGTINLDASGSVILQSGSLLTVAAQQFDSAGKGGTILLAAGSEINGVIDSTAVLDIQTGSTINLSVASAARLGDFTGSLHLRAPQLANNSDLQVNPINGTIIGASKIVVEGYQLFDLTGTGGEIDSTVQDIVFANGNTFVGPNGTITNGYTAMLNRLFANNQGLVPVAIIEAGAEIINRNGDLTLGSPNSDSSSDWNLATRRFGPDGAPGQLTLRAAGNLVFYNALSDGFDPNSSLSLYSNSLLARNPLLPANEQSWSYHLAAGADFAAADFHYVQPLSLLGVGGGSILLGKNYDRNIFGNQNTATWQILPTHYQVIRTGSGDIDIVAGRDVKLLNQLATIYTAGTQVTDATLGGTFDLPIPNFQGQNNALGVAQQNPVYSAQYSFAGGNVMISAQGDIVHQTQIGGQLVDDSSRELPINWLYRRGLVDPATGLFGIVGGAGAPNDVGSTTWWIDFSNFFEGVGALGGGNVSLTAGHDVRNIDAVAPTNARMPGRDANGHRIAPNAASMIELGGGDVAVRAGNNIDGGVYYVERGHGLLTAGNEIRTNATRSPSLTNIDPTNAVLVEQTWLPTTLFVGKASFDVTAGGDLLLGPVANPFVLPEGVNNSYWYKTYFSTYAANSGVTVESLTGNVTLRENATVNETRQPLLQAWLDQISLFHDNGRASWYQPWLRLDETSVNAFTTVVSLLPPSVRATAFSGDLNVQGDLTLFPAANGTVDLVARGAIDGLQPDGSSAVVGGTATAWDASRINLSDADPNRVPGLATPFAYRTTLATPGSRGSNLTSGDSTFLNATSALFAETGSTQGGAAVLENKQTLHAPGPLHATDAQPIHLYAGRGDISGFTLFSGKAAQVVAGRDITDIAFYIQNVRAGDVSLVAAGRDLIAYDPSSTLRLAGNAPGNIVSVVSPPASGDIQISGPGTIEVLAGRNFDLGVGPNNPDGAAVGLVSIGNGRNPYLPFDGANIIAGAGIGISSGLSASRLDFGEFESQFLDPNSAGAQAARYLPELGKLLGLTNASNSEIWTQFQQLSPEKQDALALDVFYLVLRNSGRDRNDPNSPNFRSFTDGQAAIAALFPESVHWHGDISLTSREIKTKNGGNIDIFAPGGQITVGLTVGANALDQGILTEHGGNISIFTHNSVNVGTSRIFTLRGGNEIIWSSVGDIAAGASSKTVKSAPPTRVLVDPQSADVQTDLAGLATGGGIGVLETVAGVPPADVDLIAPNGTIDAGEAGIRVSGNLNLAALIVLNASNIQVGGASVGVPTVAAPNIGGLTVASNATGAATSAAQQLAGQNTTAATQEEVPSIISVEVLGYGSGSEDEEQRKKKKKEQEQQPQSSADESNVRLSQLGRTSSHDNLF
jgi:filamentous hemagglutinin